MDDAHSRPPAISAIGQLLGVFGPVESADDNADLHRLMIAALDRRVYSWCGHLRRDAPRPVFVSLSHGAIVCRACTSTVLAKPLVDDGKCDLCDAESTWFREMAVVADLGAGPAVIFANVCNNCHAVCASPIEAAA